MFGLEKKLEHKKIAILATDGFEEAELFEPRKALLEAGALVDVISLKPGIIVAWKSDEWSRELAVDLDLNDARPEDYDGLVLPGGVINADKLRREESAIEFVESFVNAGKPIAAICHGSWILIETGMVKGKTMTAWPSLRTDLINAGADWVDEEVHVDHGLVTSRKPSDIPAFNKKMIEEFSEGAHDVLPGSRYRVRKNEDKGLVDRLF